MQVDLSSIIISLVIFTIVAIPIIYDQMNKKKHLAQRTLIDHAGRRELSLDQYDVQPEAWGIGIDTGARRLIYMSLNGEKREEIVNLKKVEKCTFIDGNGTPDAPALQLHFKTSTPPETFSFRAGANKKENPAEQAHKWETLINKEVA